MTVGPADVRDVSGGTGRRVLGDRYELVESIGSGGMAEVFRAQDRVLDRAVAIKVLRECAPEAEARDRFTTEARTLASLNHPGLVTLLDAGIGEDQPYLVMVLVEGPSLSQMIRQGGPVDPVRVAAIGAQVAEALQYAHDNGVVHRDVKPGNILLEADDRALLADFGIARLLAESSRHTRTGDTIGSPAYLSPEQVTGGLLSPAVDVYSLGLVLLEALTAQRAYEGTPLEAAVARLSTAPPIPAWLDADWRDLLTRMTALDPEHRPTPREIAASLGSTTSTMTQPNLDLGSQTRVLELPDVAASTATGVVRRERPRSFWLGVAAAAVVVVAAIVLLWPGGAPAQPTQPAYQVPNGVPARMHQPLANLHAAVDGAQK